MRFFCMILGIIYQYVDWNEFVTGLMRIFLNKTGRKMDEKLSQK